ncbi:MAG: hypothetical protein ACRCS9_08775 [Hyphomicrobium sp.]
MTTRIALIDEALVLNGSEPVGSEAAPGADTHLAAYNGAKDLVLTCHPWSFCTFTRKLGRLTASPDAHWTYAFELPGDMIGAPRAYFERGDARIPYTRVELTGDRKVLADVPDLWLTFTKDVPPGLWPSYVTEVVRLLVRSELAHAVREDRVLRDRLREDAIGTPHQMLQGGLLAAARALDDMAKPSPGVAEFSNPLIDVRTSRGGY